MMKFTIFLLFAVLIPEQLTDAGPCPIDDLIDRKIQGIVNSAVSSAVARVRLVCTTVKSNGRLATCPSGYKATGCSCGMACGSWDIRSDTTCHCQCSSMDWASARCCRTG